MRPSKLGGYGIFLVSSIETNDVVFRVPLHTMITEEKSKDSVIGKAVQKVFGGNIPNRIILTLYLLHRRRMTSANNLSSSRISNTLRYYLRCLPVSYNTPLFLASLEAAEGREIFKEDERAKDFHRMLGTAVGERERNRFVQIKNTYNALFPKLSISFPGTFLPRFYV